MTSKTQEEGKISLPSGKIIDNSIIYLRPRVCVVGCQNTWCTMLLTVCVVGCQNTWCMMLLTVCVVGCQNTWCMMLLTVCMVGCHNTRCMMLLTVCVVGCQNTCCTMLLLLLLLEALQLQRSFGHLSEFLPFGPVSDTFLPVCYFHLRYVALYIIFPSIFRSS